MEKLKMQSVNKVEENIKKIGELFPNCLTERIGEDGKVEACIDFDMLKQELSSVVVEGSEERYQFTWPDKKKAILLANAPISATLRPCREESVDFDNTKNLYIEGDNLDVLKLLQETYLGKIKMIYIDPPYNTGNDFVYEDDFAEDADEYLANSGQFDDQGNRLVQNTESNGRFHTDWLNMIYPRLKLAKDLLADEGVIFISIDDNEVDNLLQVCKEIFGSGNFISNFIIASNSAKNNSKYVSVTHEYLICIAKQKTSVPEGWAVVKNNSENFKKISKQLLESNMDFDEVHSELLSLVKYPKYYEFDHYTYVDKRGPFRASDLTAPGSKAKYDVIHPVTGKPCKTGTRGWAYSETEMKKLIDNDYILFGKDETVMPQLKNYLFENEKSLPKSVLFFDSQSSTKWMKAQNFGFDFPKAIEYIQYIISMYPEEDFILLDFFSGSGTTAHSLLKLNAKDGGTRKFIMVQLPEETNEESEAYKAGYKNICEIGKERIRRAGAKIKEENPMTASDLDVGFRVLKLDTSNIKDVSVMPGDADFDFTKLADNIKEDRSPEDLLFQVMLDLGVELSASIREETICGKKVFYVAEELDNFLIACFDKDVTDDVITEIAKKKPYYFVTRDASMATDSVATNFDQIFATYSPGTVRKVL